VTHNHCTHMQIIFLLDVFMKYYIVWFSFGNCIDSVCFLSVIYFLKYLSNTFENVKKHLFSRNLIIIHFRNK